MSLNNKQRIRRTLGAALVLIYGQAQAEDAGIQIKWNGVLSAGAAITNVKPHYSEKYNEDGSTADTRAGITASAQLNRDWWVGMQLFSHSNDVDEPGRSIDLDWAYASYRPNDALAVNLGRIKFPNNLVSEYYEIGFAYPWIRPPEEFYSHVSLGPNLTVESINGATVIFTQKFGAGARFALQPFIGDTNIDDGFQRKMLGMKASISRDNMEVLAGYMRSNLQLGSLTSAHFAEANDKNLQVWNVGFSYDRNIVVYTEYGRSTLEDRPEFDSTGGYATFGYRFGKYLPHVTYAVFDQESGLGQKSTALGLRRELTSFSAFKFEWKQIDPEQRPTALASGAQPAGLFESMPDKNRVNLYSVSVDFVF